MAKSVKFSDCMASFDAIMADIEARRFAPIYLLSGDEGYFIDAIADRLADTILNEAERSFNQITVYGADVDADAYFLQWTAVRRKRAYNSAASYRAAVGDLRCYRACRRDRCL